MKNYLSIFLVLFSLHSISQINHWETVIQEGDQCEYLIPSVALQTNWNDTTFNSSSWSNGITGIGYADGDDNTTITASISVYIRQEFMITDTSAIEKAILNVDYDDAFVAYLNGVEIARANISGTPPAYNQGSDGLHEASLYQGIVPDNFIISKQTLSGLLNQGNNVLAIQCHNESVTSSDMSVIPFFSVAINNTSSDYSATPFWFAPPFEFASSNLPIIIINTNGQTIYDDPKIMADFGIIHNSIGNLNYLTDPINEYNGKCGIEIRGESSQSFAKKSYAIELWDDLGNDMDSSFLGFTREEDFVLYGPYSDKSLLNNVLAMHIGEKTGHYASQTQLTEVVLNGDYQGIYVLMEKIKRDKGRVDIAKLDSIDLSGDQLTGGYIFRIDKGVYDGWNSNFNKYGSTDPLYFQFFYPNQDNIQAQQAAYIENYMDEFEEAVASPTFENSLGKHYTDYVDLRSFVDNFIINELSKNVDGYRLSTYFHKDKDSKGGKITAGPYWDFNLSFGNGDYCSGDDVTGWEYYQCSGNSPFWWDTWIQTDTLFQNAVRCRWEELREGLLHTDSINNYLDSMANYIANAQARNFQQYNIMGTYVWPNSAAYANSASHSEVIINMKSFLSDRSDWLDNNIPGIAQYCNLYEPTTEDTTSTDTTTSILVVRNTNTQLLPNPNNGNFRIVSNLKIYEINVIDALGRVIYSASPNEKSVTIQLPLNSSTGIYSVSVQYDNQKEFYKILNQN